jgi:DNA-binding response OmpR family regulator
VGGNRDTQIRQDITALQIKVLLIEDKPSEARLTRERLLESSDSLFELDVAETLEAGIQRFSAGVDVVLLDLALPDGQEDFLRAKARVLGAAIIILTGSNDDSLGRKLVHDGARDFVVKFEATSNNLKRRSASSTKN